jgi:hypothetical protein
MSYEWQINHENGDCRNTNGTENSKEYRRVKISVSSYKKGVMRIISNVQNMKEA